MPKNNYNNNYNDNYYDDGSNVNNQSYDDIYSDSSNRRRISQKTKAKKIFSLILIVILVLVLALGVYTILVLFRINYTNDSPDSSAVEETAGELKSDPNIDNIMIFGADNHAEGENGRSDTMILLSIDKNTRKLKMTSFLRDLYLTIPGYGEDRLNAAYSYGGASLAVETVEYNFGIKIDKYAVVDFESFTSIIDALGGIDIELMAEEIDYINWQCWKNGQVETRDELNIDDYDFYINDDGDEVATVHLNGRQALWHARNRGQDGICSGDDFTRTQRQRTVMDTIFSDLKSANPLTLMKVVYETAPMITTNISSWEIIGMGAELISCLKYDREEYSVPTSDNFSNTWVYDAQVLTIDDMELEKERLYEFIFNES